MSEPHTPRSGGALPGLLKGLATTARTLARPTHTTEYPDAPPHLPPRSRGVIALLEENCTSCMLCARECPDWCIYIDSHKETIPATTPGGRERQRNVLDRFAIDFSLCMYCGICIEVCPFDALHWSPEFEYSELDIRDLLHEKDRLGQWMPTVPPPPALDEHSAEPAEVAAANKPARPARAGGAPTPARAARAERPERPARPEGAVRPERPERPERAARPERTVRAPRSDAEAAAAAQQAAAGEGVGPQTTPHSPPPSERPAAPQGPAATEPPADSVPAEPPTPPSEASESGTAETKSTETPPGEEP